MVGREMGKGKEECGPHLFEHVGLRFAKDILSLEHDSCVESRSIESWNVVVHRVRSSVD